MLALARVSPPAWPRGHRRRRRNRYRCGPGRSPSGLGANVGANVGTGVTAPGIGIGGVVGIGGNVGIGNSNTGTSPGTGSNGTGTSGGSGTGTSSAAGASASNGASTGGTTGAAGTGNGANGGATASVASLGVGSVGVGGVGGVAAANAISAEEDALLRVFLSGVSFNDGIAASSLTATQTASLLYRSGNKRAAKELLCDQREVYTAFKRTASPCLTRANSELRPSDGVRQNYQAVIASAPVPVFRQNGFRSQADCLTAAHNSGVPLSTCSGR